MEKNPANRYQSATEMLFDVEEVIKNPATTFDYSYFVDEEPTKYVIKTVDHTEKPSRICDPSRNSRWWRKTPSARARSSAL